MVLFMLHPTKNNNLGGRYLYSSAGLVQQMSKGSRVLLMLKLLVLHLMSVSFRRMGDRFFCLLSKNNLR